MILSHVRLPIPPHRHLLQHLPFYHTTEQFAIDFFKELGYNVHESNEQCQYVKKRIGCSQPNPLFYVLIGRLPVNEKAVRLLREALRKRQGGATARERESRRLLREALRKIAGQGDCP